MFGFAFKFSKGGKVKFTFPSGFTASVDFNVFRADKTYSTDFDFATNSTPSGNTYYVSELSGNNANDGLSEGNAFRDIDHALSQFSAAGGTIILLDKYYWRQNLDPNTYTPAGNIAIKSGRAGNAMVYVTRAEKFSALTWTQNGTYPDVWQATRSISAMVVDMTQTGEDGDIPRMAGPLSFA